MIVYPGHFELFVRDPAVARNFYERVLGFTLTAVQGDNDEFIWLELGGRELLLRPGNPPAGGSSYHAAGVAIVLYTDSLAATAALWRERGLEFHGFDGSLDCLTFTDPDGHWFQLVDPSSDH